MPRRQPRPYWKKSHKAWYVKINGTHHPLGKDEEAAWERYYKLMAGRRELSQDPLVLDVMEAFLTWSDASQEPGTYGFYLKYCRSFANAVPENLTTKGLKPHHLIGWVDANWPATTRSPSTRRNAMRAIQRVFSWAVEMGHVDRNPLAGVKKPMSTRRETYLWPEQYEQVLSLIRDQPFRDYVEILRHTGCRPQEARAVEARYCLWKDRCWVLPAKIAKGKKEPRTVLLDDRAMEISARLAAKYPEGPIFRNFYGAPWTERAITKRFSSIQSKLDFHVTAYAIRHTFATDAILRGVDLVTIAKLMGHKDLKMLSQVYEHISQRQDHLRKGLDQATGHLVPQDTSNPPGAAPAAAPGPA